jgi:hypothetical protein
MAYPIDLQIDHGDGSRNRGYAILGIIWYLKAVLLIPHLIAATLVGTIAVIAAWFGYWAIALTGRQPAGISNLIAGAIRWNIRMYAWLGSTVDEYPPFGFEDGAHAAQTTVAVDDGPRDRLLGAGGIIGIKHLIAVPHLIIVTALESVAWLAAWVGFVLIGFNGSLPKALHDFIVGVLRWQARVWAWLGSLTDEYPPFSLE